MDIQEGFLFPFGMTVGLRDRAKMQSIFALTPFCSHSEQSEESLKAFF
jgi:hypothetical protein